MKDERARRDHAGGSRHGTTVRKSPPLEPPPPEAGFDGERQCSHREGGQRCAYEALPRLRLCAYHRAYDPTPAKALTRGRYAESFASKPLADKFHAALADPDLRKPEREVALSQVALGSLVEAASVSPEEFARAAPDLIKYSAEVTKGQERAFRMELDALQAWGPNQIAEFAVALADAISLHVRDPRDRENLRATVSALFRGHAPMSTLGEGELVEAHVQG